MKKYRTSMTITIDVWAHNSADAIDSSAMIYWDFDHCWDPDTVIVLDDDEQDFFPCNEKDV